MRTALRHLFAIGLLFYAGDSFAGVTTVKPAAGETPLIVREYRVPPGYMPTSDLPFENRSGVPFAPGPTAIYIRSRNVVIVHATAAQQRIARKHIQEQSREVQAARHAQPKAP